jgi:hypothetical protein
MILNLNPDEILERIYEKLGQRRTQHCPREIRITLWPKPCCHHFPAQQPIMGQRDIGHWLQTPVETRPHVEIARFELLEEPLQEANIF